MSHLSWTAPSKFDERRGVRRDLRPDPRRVFHMGAVPYAHVRHPMYTGAVVLIFAMPIVMGSL
jgi:protein-S-isoprenylcysteine O-methyltransferase Ste14